MKVMLNLLLPTSIILIVLGALVQSIRPLVTPIGVALLLITYIFEKLFLRNKRYRIEALSETSKQKGSISIEGSQLIVSDKWSLKKCLMLDGFEGHYNVGIFEISKDDFALVSKIEIINDTPLVGAVKNDISEIVVDTGWLMFVGSSATNDLKPKELEKIIQGELNRLPSNKPLCLWLKNHEGKEVGIVVSTGEGDGVYQVKYTTKGAKLEAVEVSFLNQP